MGDGRKKPLGCHNSVTALADVAVAALADPAATYLWLQTLLVVWCCTEIGLDGLAGN